MAAASNDEHVKTSLHEDFKTKDPSKTDQDSPSPASE
jgi:hypothetical protein